MFKRQNLFGWMALIALTPGIMFVFANVTKYQLGIPTVYDAFDSILPTINGTSGEVLTIGMLLGLPIALLLAGLPIARIHITYDGKVIVSEFRLEPRTLNIMIIGICLLVGMIFTVYFFVENFSPNYW